MKDKMIRFIAAILFVSMLSVQGYAVVVASYDYASASGADPTNQGWTFQTNSTTNSYLGGYDASVYTGQSGWRIVDGTSSGYANYQINLTTEEATGIKTAFTATWTFKLDGTAWKKDGTGSVTSYYLPPNQSRQNNNGLWIETSGDNSFRYYLVVSADANGNLQIVDGSVRHTLTSGGGNNGYDTEYTVTVAYDGSNAVLSYGGSDFTLTKLSTTGQNRILFGAHSSSGQGSVVYRAFSVSISSNTAGNIQPTDGAVGVLPTAILEWVAPSEYTPTGYDVYFGTNPTVTANPKVVDNTLQTTYDPPADLDFSTIYYWQVDTYDGAAKHVGQPWSFATRPENVIKVACIGDSITYGAGITDRENNSYPAQLQALLGPGYDVRNYGKSGARVSHLHAKYYKTYAQAEYNAAIAFEPDIVIFALGINDCSIGQWETNKPVFVADYKDLIDDFSSLPSNPQVYVGTLMPVFAPPYAYPAIYDNMAECDPLIAQVATEEGAELVDLHTPLEPYPEYYPDGLHPDENGAAIIAETVYEATVLTLIESDDMAVNEEGPTSDTYTIVLNGTPQENVTLTLTPSESGQVVLEVDSVETDTIVFTTADYDQPRTVTVTAVDDAVFEGPHSINISHSSFSADSTYHNLVMPDVSVNITDNDYYGKRVKVFLIGGQSNAAGSGVNTEYPALYQSPQTDVEFWVGGRLPGDNVPDYAAWDRPADTTFRPLELGSGNHTDGSRSGFEMSLGRTLKDALPYDNIAIIKYGMSGSALDRAHHAANVRGNWDSGPPTWTPSEGYAGVRYHVFMNSGVLPALQAIIDRGDMPEIAGMFWMQGETDAGSTTSANNYEDNLNDLISSVRTELSAPEMRFVIGRIRTMWGSATNNATVRTAMQNVTASDPLAEWIDTDDLAVNSHLGDNGHYSAAGLVDMGERFANTYLSTLPKRGDVEPDGDIDLSDFARLAEQWLNANCGFCSGADLNSDLDVDFEDLVILTEGWLDS